MTGPVGYRRQAGSLVPTRFSDETVQGIRDALASGIYPQTVIAGMFGVSQKTVSRIKRGITYRDTGVTYQVEIVESPGVETAPRPTLTPQPVSVEDMDSKTAVRVHAEMMTARPRIPAWGEEVEPVAEVLSLNTYRRKLTVEELEALVVEYVECTFCGSWPGEQCRSVKPSGTHGVFGLPRSSHDRRRQAAKRRGIL